MWNFKAKNYSENCKEYVVGEVVWASFVSEAYSVLQSSHEDNVKVFFLFLKRLSIMS